LNLVVFGAGGQLGSAVVSAASADHNSVFAATRAECDITDAGAVTALLDARQPGVVINCAAWTGVDAAEQHEAEARLVNTLAPGVIADVCAERGIRLCHVSTDYVFDGSATKPIPEDAEPHPLSVYGRTKLAGEVAVQQRCPDHLVVRTSWLYGGGGPNFVLTMVRLIDEGRPLHVVADQHGSPTWTEHLATGLLRLVAIAPAGTYHLTSSGETTWHGLAVAVAADAGAGVEVTPLTTDQYPTKATRPRYSVLENRAWLALGEPPLPHWRDGVRAYLAQLGRLGRVAR
jgi:dTDP-4-dehydrorhamnose reductase